MWKMEGEAVGDAPASDAEEARRSDAPIIPALAISPSAVLWHDPVHGKVISCVSPDGSRSEHLAGEQKGLMLWATLF